jgi:hypothetical protein
MFGTKFILPTLDQSERIQGMARYMNESGSSSELNTLLYLLGGFMVIILLLKGVAKLQSRKPTNSKSKK